MHSTRHCSAKRNTFVGLVESVNVKCVRRYVCVFRMQEHLRNTEKTSNAYADNLHIKYVYGIVVLCCVHR